MTATATAAASPNTRRIIDRVALASRGAVTLPAPLHEGDGERFRNQLAHELDELRAAGAQVSVRVVGSHYRIEATRGARSIE